MEWKKHVADRTDAFLLQAKLGPRETYAVTRITTCVQEWIAGEGWPKWKDEFVPMPTELQTAMMQARYQSYDPTEFDWTLVPMTKNMRDKLADFRARIATQTTP